MIPPATLRRPDASLDRAAIPLLARQGSIDARDWLLTANLGVGYGIHTTRSGMEENSFGGGGSGILLVPTLRISNHASWAKVGTSLRCILPQSSLTSDNTRRYGALLLLAFDLGW